MPFYPIKQMNQKNHIIFLLLLSIVLTGCQQQNLSPPKNYDITCYAATYGKGIYKTDNGGRSWYPLDLDQKDLYAYFKRLYLDSREKDMLYVATTGAGLFLLNLQTGSLKKVDRFKDENVRSVTFRNTASDLLGSREVLVAINDGGIFEAPNALGRWQTSNQGLVFRGDVNTLFSHGSTLYAGTVKDLFRWDESSKQWVEASQGISNKNILSMGAHPEGKIFYAGSGAYEGKRGRSRHIPCLYKSPDRGLTWIGSDKGIRDGTLIYAIAINPGCPERIYLGTSDGVYRSTDNGLNWVKVTNNLPKGLKVFDIKISRMADGEDVVYAATSRGIFMTQDTDQTGWSNKSFGLEPTAITSIILFPN